MFTLSLIWVLVTGACLGSFLNVVILRLPSDEHTFLTKRSYCYTCRKQLRWSDLIPIFSWFFLRGKCRFCESKIAVRYVLVELWGMLLAGLCFVFASSLGLGLESFVVCMILTAIALIDLDAWVIPVQLVLSLAVVGLGFGYFWGLQVLQERLIGMFSSFLFFAAFLLFSTWILRLTGRLKKDENSMGWGDPILIAGIGATLPWMMLPVVVFLGSAQGVIAYFLFSLRPNWDAPERSMPLGTFLSIAAVEIILYNLIS